MTAFTWEELGDGVVLWTMDDPDASAITINGSRPRRTPSAAS
jgi:hypothetical protein